MVSAWACPDCVAVIVIAPLPAFSFTEVVSNPSVTVRNGSSSVMVTSAIWTPSSEALSPPDTEAILINIVSLSSVMESVVGVRVRLSCRVPAAIVAVVEDKL